MKKLAVIKSENTEIIEAIKEYFKGKDVQIFEYDNITEYLKTPDTADLIAEAEFERYSAVSENCGKILNIYASLLPSFKDCSPIKEAYTSGVKVTGVTVYYADKKVFGKIIAQYPVLIGLTTSFGELEKELETVGKFLYPHVIDAVLNDKVFDFSDLFKSSCCGNSGSCTGACSGCGKSCG